MPVMASRLATLSLLAPTLLVMITAPLSWICPAEITTVEGLTGATSLSGLQQAFLDEGAVQCGYCTPGMVMAAEGLLRVNSDPDEAEIRHALAGNICRCNGFETIVRAVGVEAATRRTAEAGR